MKHTWAKDTPEGLGYCDVCHGAEGTLPTECPGEPMGTERGDLVYRAVLDFKSGRWEPGTLAGAVLVCGGRDFKDRAAVFGGLDEFNARSPIGLVISGAAKGVDSLAASWARSRGVLLEEKPADWEAHRPPAGSKRKNPAGMIRNQAMLDMLITFPRRCVLAFPGGVGTGRMLEIARKAGVETFEWKYD